MQESGQGAGPEIIQQFSFNFQRCDILGRCFGKKGGLFGGKKGSFSGVKRVKTDFAGGGQILLSFEGVHTNNGSCLSCGRILNAYPKFNSLLRNWFLDLQAKHPEVHVSAAGRGRIAQESLFERKASRAHYGQSSHNFNAAIDVFRLLDGKYNLDEDWFNEVIAPALRDDLVWYGRRDALFYERPHIELKGWREMVKRGELRLVE